MYEIGLKHAQLAHGPISAVRGPKPAQIREWPPGLYPRTRDQGARSRDQVPGFVFVCSLLFVCCLFVIKRTPSSSCSSSATSWPDQLGQVQLMQLRETGHQLARVPGEYFGN